MLIPVGWAASAPLGVAGGTIDDLFCDREKATSMAIFTAMPLLGTIV